jgi:DNA-binding response OmpR family regulator
MKLLIVEDEKGLSDNIVGFLNNKDYLCEQAFTCCDAVMKVGVYDYDCVLLDLMLPDGNGLEVLRQIKKRNTDTGIIIVSAKGSTDDVVTGLELGADDYIAKPFNLTELAMRVFALLRRRNFTGSNMLVSHEVEIDLLSKTVKVNGLAVELTKSEYELLLFLISNKNRVVSKTAIAEHLTGEMADDLDNFNFVFAHIKNLKRKLSSAHCVDHIKTLYGTGYKWTE